MSRTIKFVGTAMVMATADGEYRMELKGPPGCAMWSAEDVGKSFDVHIAEVEGDDSPSWADAPEWAWFRAQNKTGRWCWYEDYPTSEYVPGTDYWSSPGRWQMSVLNAPNPNWQTTLGPRPKPKPECVEFSGGCIYLDNDGALRIKLSDEAADKFTGIVVCRNSAAVTMPSADWAPAWVDDYSESVGIGPLYGRQETELRSCPFCGAEATLWGPVKHNTGWNVRCNNCRITTLEHGSAKGAEADWNRRA